MSETSAQRFVGKSVIVTGASAGIGAATARAFASEGARLVLVARGREALDEISAEIVGAGGEAIAVAMDVADSDAAAAMLVRAQAEFGAIDILVNNAARNERGAVEGRDPADLANMVDVNLRAPVMLCRLVLPYLRQAGGGAIVNVASLAGMVPLPDEATYSATKFGLRAFTFALARELEGSGITVSAVSPGPVDTRFLFADVAEIPDMVLSQPVSTAEEIAALILACAADGRGERAAPRLSGYLATLGYVFPPLRRALTPMLELLGRQAKKRYQARSADEAAKPADEAGE